MGEKIKFDVLAADSFTTALTQAGWLGAPVEAACIVRQGHSPSIASLAIGYGVIKMFKPRGAKHLPRKFVLAVAGDRVVAFEAGGVSIGDEDEGIFRAKVDSDEQGSWSRSEVSMAPATKGMLLNADLNLGGTVVPCAAPDSDTEPAFEDLMKALGGQPAA